MVAATPSLRPTARASKLLAPRRWSGSIPARRSYFSFSTFAAISGNVGAAAHGLMVLIVLLAIYFLPWFVARSRRHHATDAIFIANLVLGWTFLGWFGALAWAAMPVKREHVA
jgi:Superinfection immunity protein